jgi:Spy/CpxP family protein refolding chaperone
MKRSTMRGWTLVPAALLLVGVVWTGTAGAEDSDFRGPGGLSGPSDPKGDERWERGERRQRAERGQARMRGGKRGDLHGAKGMHGMRHGGPGMRGRDGRHGRTDGGMRGKHGRMMGHLDLSDRQREQIQGIRQGQQRRMIQVRADIQKASLDLRELMQAENPDRARIDAAIDRLAELRAGAHKARAAAHLEMRSVLTEEQRRKLRDHPGMRESGARRGDAGRS